LQEWQTEALNLNNTLNEKLDQLTSNISQELIDNKAALRVLSGEIEEKDEV
jgi:hypothetical protein